LGAIYDATMHDWLDLPLLSSLESVDWNVMTAAVDLACGTGRTGAWLKGRGIRRGDGVDASPEMLDQAAAKRIYHGLTCADAATTALVGGDYDLAVSSLAVWHIADLAGLDTDAPRLTRSSGSVVLIDYHPFMLKGVPTHFNQPDGETVEFANVTHLIGDHVEAERRAGLALLELREQLVDAEWVGQNHRMASHAGHPVSFAIVWARD
jgi:SAM-dependent methyltransferase